MTSVPTTTLRAGAGLALAAAIAAAAIAPAAGDARPGAETLRYRTVVVEAAEIDHGDPGPSLGDQFIFHDDLRRGGRSIGHNGGVCTMTSLQRGEFLCAGTAEIDGRGTISARFFLRPGSSERVRMAVTGGTGRYRGARGDGTAVLLSETEARVTLRLR